MILDILVLFVLAAAVGAGVGGGGLLVVYLTLARGFEQISAQAVNLAFFIVSALASACMQAKHRTMPDLRLIFLVSGAAIPGVLIGTAVRDMLSGYALRMIFGILLLITAFLVLRREFPPIISLHMSKKKNSDIDFSKKS